VCGFLILVEAVLAVVVVVVVVEEEVKARGACFARDSGTPLILIPCSQGASGVANNWNSGVALIAPQKCANIPLQYIITSLAAPQRHASYHPTTRCPRRDACMHVMA
jgi:hypothetical protein